MCLMLTREQVRRVDQIAVQQYGMTPLVLMENAGRGAATIINEKFGSTSNALICCGPGNNGGDGCVIARHLHNAGWTVRVMVTGDQSKMSPDMLSNYRIIESMGLEPMIATDHDAQQAMLNTIDQDELVIDALLGTGFQGQVRSPLAELIEAMNDSPKQSLIAIDIPSGLECDAGTPTNATIRADQTITFVAPKVGFSSPEAASFLGQVDVVDIGVPQEAISEAAR